MGLILSRVGDGDHCCEEGEHDISRGERRQGDDPSELSGNEAGDHRPGVAGDVDGGEDRGTLGRADPPIIARTVALMAMPCAAPAMAEQIRNGTTVPATSAVSSPSNASVKAIMPSRCAAAAANRPPIGAPMMLGAM